MYHKHTAIYYINFVEANNCYKYRG